MSKGIYVVLTRNYPDADKVESLGLDGQKYPSRGLTRFLHESKLTGTINDVIDMLVNAKPDELNATYTQEEATLAEDCKTLRSKPNMKVAFGKDGVYETKTYSLTEPISMGYANIHRRNIARGPSQSGEYKSLEMALEADLGGGRA
ncbi:MAG TPA: hypothetical protein VK158_04250 [Acidobacteriota bacterium]|nr:hypothetical protein [Acidobacteriota bacterium]